MIVFIFYASCLVRTFLYISLVVSLFSLYLHLVPEPPALHSLSHRNSCLWWFVDFLKLAYFTLQAHTKTLNVQTKKRFIYYTCIHTYIHLQHRLLVFPSLKCKGNQCNADSQQSCVWSLLLAVHVISFLSMLNGLVH